MDLEAEILARIRASKVWDKDAKASDFQIKAGDNGIVLINLKTGRAYLIYDDASRLHDLEDLVPGLVQQIERENADNLPDYLKD